MSGKSKLDAGRNWPHWMIGFWISLCALLQVAGWGLSAVGQLNAAGYAGVLGAAAVVAILFYRNRIAALRLSALGLRKLVRRFHRLWPLTFLLIAGLITLGAMLHPPNNYDALSYRIPRVLNWLAENRWHWIHTQDARMNVRACGNEWLLAPLLALTGTDRWIFIINLISYLLIPSLLFGVYTRLGVSRKVAWRWMWLLPTGYCYLLQAGGSANDLPGATFALAAMYFALRARDTGRVRDAWLGLLSAALLTSAKSSNLPLLLPIGLAFLPLWRMLLTRVGQTVAILLAAGAVSSLPTFLLNAKYCGDWSGLTLESSGSPNVVETRVAEAGAERHMGFVLAAQNPLVGISGNALILLCENFLPPIFPIAQWWNRNVLNWLPEFYRELAKQNFSPAFLTVRELAGEEAAGLGFGLSWLLVFTCLATWWVGRRNAWRTSPAQSGGWQRWLQCSPWVALLIFMARNGVASAARLLGPYFVLLVPVLLSGRYTALVLRSRWWHRAALATVALAGLVLVLAVERPLWPARTVLGMLAAKYPNQPFLRRAHTVYSIYADRYDVFKPVRAILPPEEPAIGLLCAYDEAGTSLWRPFGQRRVRQILFTDKREDLDRWGVKYIVARDFGARTEAWLERINAERLGTFELRLYAARPPVLWHVVRLR